MKNTDKIKASRRTGLALAAAISFTALSLTGCPTTDDIGIDADGFHYKVNRKTIIITGYEGNESSVTIPNKTNGRPVTAIGNGAFFDC